MEMRVLFVSPGDHAKKKTKSKLVVKGMPKTIDKMGTK